MKPVELDAETALPPPDGLAAALLVGLARGAFIGGAAAGVVGSFLLLLVLGGERIDRLPLAVGLVALALGAPAAACGVVERRWREGGRASDLLAVGVAFVGATLTTVAVAAQVLYLASIFDGRAALFDYRAAGDLPLARVLLAGGAYAAALAAGVYPRRRGRGAQHAALWTGVTLFAMSLLAVLVGRDEHDPRVNADVVGGLALAAVVLATMLAGLTAVADDAVARLRGAWRRRGRSG
ncbi:MAG: hypothetical protein M9894_16530 [Planctomycetes bacterium]|nr:hypothetical protein [Planctomycetota bacterium]